MVPSIVPSWMLILLRPMWPGRYSRWGVVWTIRPSLMPWLGGACLGLPARVGLGTVSEGFVETRSMWVQHLGQDQQGRLASVCMENVVPPVISRETFDSVQRQL